MRVTVRSSSPREATAFVETDKYGPGLESGELPFVAGLCRALEAAAKAYFTAKLKHRRGHR